MLHDGVGAEGIRHSGADVVPPGPVMNRMIATMICGFTGGLPDESYPPYSMDLRLAFEAIDAFAAAHPDVKFTIEYPMPEIWVKRYSDSFSAGWVPAAYCAEDSLPHAICRALLRAAGYTESY